MTSGWLVGRSVGRPVSRSVGPLVAVCLKRRWLEANLLPRYLCFPLVSSALHHHPLRASVDRFRWHHFPDAFLPDATANGANGHWQTALHGALRCRERPGGTAGRARRRWVTNNGARTNLAAISPTHRQPPYGAKSGKKMRTIIMRRQFTSD